MRHRLKYPTSCSAGLFKPKRQRPTPPASETAPSCAALLSSASDLRQACIDYARDARQRDGFAFFVAPAAIGVVAPMMCAYFVPFHIPHGPPLFHSVGSASSCLLSGVSTMTCGGLTTHLFVA